MNVKKLRFLNFPLGKKIVWIIVLILFVGVVNAESIFLSGYMKEGQTKVYEIDGGVYVINLLTVSEATEKAVFRLNDEMSKGIKLKDSYVFEDGSEIVLRELVINDAGDANDEAYYYFYGTGKKTLPLTNVSMYADLCNFDRQCLNETKEDCCYDCGCGEGAECANNRCVALEKKEEDGAEEKEEVEEVVEGEVEDKKETTKDDKEKKAAYAMLIIILLLFLLIAWFVLKKKRSSVF